MRRRRFLGTLGGGATLLAGCTGLPNLSSSTSVPDELPRVTVEYRWSGGLSPVGSTTLTVEPGTIGWTTTCRRDEDFGIDVERYLEPDAYTAVQRLVVRSEPATWRSEYSCRDVCATDDGRDDLSVTVADVTHETSIDPARKPPPRLAALRDRLEDFTGRFRDLDQCVTGDP